VQQSCANAGHDRYARRSITGGFAADFSTNLSPIEPNLLASVWTDAKLRIQVLG
jgi:hypothetical protein